MQICDRSWKRDGQPVPATVEVTLSGLEVLEQYQLCETEAEALRTFLNDPGAYVLRPKPRAKPGSPMKVSRLQDAAPATLE